MRTALLVAVALGAVLAATSASACGLVKTVWTNLAWLPDGSALVYLTKAGVVRFDVASGEAEVISEPEDDYGPQRFALSPDGTTVVHASVGGVGSACHGYGPTLRFVRLADGKTMRRWTRWRGYFGPVVYRLDGGFLLGFEDWPSDFPPWDEDRVVRRGWLHDARGRRVGSVAFVRDGRYSPDGERLVAWDDSSLRVLQAEGWRALAETRLQPGWIEDVSWTADGEGVLTVEFLPPEPGGDEGAHGTKWLTLRSAETLDPVRSLEEAGWWVTGAAASADGQWLATVRRRIGQEHRREPARIEIRSPGTFEQLTSTTLRHAVDTPVAWSPDGRRVAVGGYLPCADPEDCGYEIGAPEILTLEELGLAGEESDPS